jgi:hypothetical protein
MVYGAVAAVRRRWRTLPEVARGDLQGEGKSAPEELRLANRGGLAEIPNSRKLFEEKSRIGIIVAPEKKGTFVPVCRGRPETS